MTGAAWLRFPDERPAERHRVRRTGGLLAWSQPTNLKARWVLVFGAMRETRCRTFQYCQIALVRRPANNHDELMQSANKTIYPKMEFFRKRLVHDIGQTGRLTWQLLRDAGLLRRISFLNDELNGIFKIVCEPVCWIFPQGDEPCIRDGLHASGQQAEIPTWPN
jgi:hypothetical protein